MPSNPAQGGAERSHVDGAVLFSWELYLDMKQTTSAGAVPAILLAASLCVSVVVVVEVPDGDAEPVAVRNVIDGDAVELKDGRRVKLVGYDAVELRAPQRRFSTSSTRQTERWQSETDAPQPDLLTSHSLCYIAVERPWRRCLGGSWRGGWRLTSSPATWHMQWCSRRSSAPRDGGKQKGGNLGGLIY